MTPSRGIENLSTSQPQSRLHGDREGFVRLPAHVLAQTCNHVPRILPNQASVLLAGDSDPFPWLCWRQDQQASGSFFLMEDCHPGMLLLLHMFGGFSNGSDGKESACNTGDPGSIPGSERSLGEGNCNPLQYSCLENPTDRGAWWACKESDPTEQVVTHLGNRTT